MKMQIALGICMQGGTELPPHWVHSTKTNMVVHTSQASCLLLACPNAESLWNDRAWSKMPVKAQKGTCIKVSSLSSSPVPPTQIKRKKIMVEITVGLDRGCDWSLGDFPGLRATPTDITNHPPVVLNVQFQRCTKKKKRSASEYYYLTACISCLIISNTAENAGLLVELWFQWAFMHPISLPRFGKPKPPGILCNPVNFRTCFYLSRLKKIVALAFWMCNFAPQQTC